MKNPTDASNWTPEISWTLRDALEKATQAATESARIDAAITATRDQLASAEAELERARATLAASESETALTGGQVDRPARKALIGARDETDFIAARLTGLDARRRDASTALIDAAAKSPLSGVTGGAPRQPSILTGSTCPRLTRSSPPSAASPPWPRHWAKTGYMPSPGTRCSAIRATGSATPAIRAAATGGAIRRLVTCTSTCWNCAPQWLRTWKALKTGPKERRCPMNNLLEKEEEMKNAR